MSKIRTTELCCPACGHLWQAILFDSVNATRLLHVTDQILDGTFERERCPECEEALQPEHDLLYSDLARGLWVVMRPPATREALERIEETVPSVFGATCDSAPPIVRAHLTDVIPRLVFGQRELRECLTVERLGVPAALVECAKLRMFRELLPELATLGPTHLLSEGVVHDGADARFVAIRAAVGGPAGVVHLPMTALGELAEKESEYRARYPALFERPYVSMRRYMCYVACPVPPFWAARCAGHGNTPESVHPSGVRNSSHASSV